MEAKNSLILSDEFLQYCELNEIKDVDDFAKKVFITGFNFIKYGTKPTKLEDIKNKVPSPPPPPARKIVEGKKPESAEEYKKRYNKIKEENKKLYDE